MKLAKEAASLSALSPLAVLARGYGFIQNDEGKTICSIGDMAAGDKIRITMKDGYADADVTSVEKGI